MHLKGTGYQYIFHSYLTLSLTAPCGRNALMAQKDALLTKVWAYWPTGRESIPILLFYADHMAHRVKKQYGTVLGSGIGPRKKPHNFKINIAAQPYV